MSDLNWIKSLVEAELKMEETGTIEFAAPFDPVKVLQNSTFQFLNSLRERFVGYTSAFNQMRGQVIGGIKVYGISKTEADFMLFRNGYKLIFSAAEPGKVSIRFQSQTIVTADPQSTAFDEDQMIAQWGAFGEVRWTFDKLVINPDHLVKYYLERFIRESAS